MYDMYEMIVPVLTVLGTMSALFLLGLLINHARAKRWNTKAVKEGEAVCRDCGHIGTLSYGMLAGKMISSANIRLICAKCDSENWYVPGGKRDHGTESSSGSHPKMAS